MQELRLSSRQPTKVGVLHAAFTDLTTAKPSLWTSAMSAGLPSSLSDAWSATLPPSPSSWPSSGCQDLPSYRLQVEPGVSPLQSLAGMLQQRSRPSSRIGVEPHRLPSTRHHERCPSSGVDVILLHPYHSTLSAARSELQPLLPSHWPRLVQVPSIADAMAI